MSVAENIFISRLQLFKRIPLIRRRQMESDAARLLKQIGSNLNPRDTLYELSMGGRQQVAIARALAQRARIILFDEPTASLTINEKQNLFQLIKVLKEQGVLIIYITHFLDEVKQICDEVCILRDGRVASVGPTVQYSLEDIIREMIGREVERLEISNNAQEKQQILLDVRSLSAGTKLQSVSFSLHARRDYRTLGSDGLGKN